MAQSVRRREYMRKYQREYQRMRRNKLKSRRGGVCEWCGYNRSLDALEWHHRDPATRLYSISNNFHRSDIEAELAKCDLVCANCHAEHHNAP